jgi:hypothetical protein
MVFKGTKHRTAEEIARQVDSIGGNMDAFTSKECICFNVKVLDENVPIALEMLTDLVLHPTLTAEDIARERGVILEEIKMDEDNPDYLVHEIFTQNFWKDHPLGKPILGTKETVKKFERDRPCSKLLSPLRSRQYYRRRPGISTRSLCRSRGEALRAPEAGAEWLPLSPPDDCSPHRHAQQESARTGTALHRRSLRIPSRTKRHAGYILNTCSAEA